MGDRRVLTHHIDVLVRARSVDFAELLGSLKREELQSICQALGLDRGGREKETLVQRILGGNEMPPKPGPARKQDAPRQASFELPPRSGSPWINSSATCGAPPTSSNATLSEPDMLGRAYEYLIEKFADDAGKKGGEFYTPGPQTIRS